MAAKNQIIPQTKADHPSLKYLYKHTKTDVSSQWYSIGLELLGQQEVPLLNTIKADNLEDASKCTVEMFLKWLEREPDASWNQLIQALRKPNIKLETLASKVEKMLSEDGDHYMADHCDINFARYSVTEAYSTLMNKFSELCMKVPQFDLGRARAACISVTSAGNFQNSVRRVESFNSLVMLVKENPMYCNWMDIRLLEVIAVSTQNRNLINLIEGFKKSVYSRTLKQVFNDIPTLKKKFPEYKDLIPTSQFKNPDDMKVEELLAISKYLPIEVLAPHKEQVRGKLSDTDEN